MPGKKESVLIKTEYGSSIQVDLYSEKEDSLVKIAESEAQEFGEAPIQLYEGNAYEYEVSPGYIIEEIQGIIKQSQRDNFVGRITPGIYVGTLVLNIIEKATGIKTPFPIEVRSLKTTYREDYRFMLEDITKACTDLLMQQTSPVTQNFTVDFNKSSDTLYQRFAFVKSIIDSEEFNGAVRRIISSPVTGWEEVEEESDIRKIRRFCNPQMQQIASSANRVRIPSGHYLSGLIDSLPHRLSISRKNETVDTPENRFIKYVLGVFRQFCSQIQHKLSDNRFEYQRAYHDALHLEEKLESILNHSLFKEISPLASIAYNSPVLQRKEGYREILKVWLMFDLAAKLIWHGGEDVYRAGKRDVAILYEYWLFFKLLGLFKEIFTIDPEPIEKLIEPTSDGLGLKLRSGQHFPLSGTYISPKRKLKIEFSYNKTFSKNGDYPNRGSWTRNMRPDYTLSFWPAEFAQGQAEEQELIVHIHFDAKYKIDFMKDIFGEDDEDLNTEKEEQRFGKYRRADLLKMHAYKDAIRRTGGAYILYPGDKNELMKGFHEIIPGLGAYVIKPSYTDDGTAELKSFINDVTEHLLNRASQRDRLSYHTYDIHKENSNSKLLESLPEVYNDKRSKPPADTFVLIGYYKDEDHYKWIESKGLYNVRINSRRGSIKLDSEVAGAEYLLLHSEGNLITRDIWRIIEKGPRIFSRSELERNGYPEPSGEDYLVYKIEKIKIDEFAGVEWDIRKLINYKGGRESAIPFAVSLVEIMRIKV